MIHKWSEKIVYDIRSVEWMQYWPFNPGGYFKAAIVLFDFQ